MTSSKGSKSYKAVILAAPFHSTGISLPSSLAAQLPEYPYVKLHVTLLSTRSPSIDPAYLGLPSTAKLPTMLLTTFENARLLIPPAPLLARFGEATIPMAEETYTLQCQIQNLRRTRDLLLPRLLSGQVTLTDTVA